ncbi:L-histidine N(alpha)-methyltransferase [Pigmentiphaga sp. NML080357]|uniref:L-histidine N(alpha)-methyltransferase n=1 Tax=Pigmentiphaga sp. NML080357 TaxID=2008675 RepID=UPI000B40A418|nr:L-histidine N(alpha)-methyltransferase [Pigmentiphaga sp. NML080357]OVZ57983.1 L-histidine N(alpha)-methyltransferase [Pigmentiphaga sp. NML080357]
MAGTNSAFSMEGAAARERRHDGVPIDNRAAELAAGLQAERACIDPKFLYDAQGCVLFNAICELEEYYPTRTERAIFEAHRATIARALPSRIQWVDLGCGDCAKSRAWLGHVDAYRYLGVDIAADWIRREVAALGRQFPQISCVPVEADFSGDFDLHGSLDDPQANPPVFFYPGSSIGNFSPERAIEFMAAICREAGPRGSLLISADLRKDRRTMERAYADDLGVTAAFNRNVLRVCNRVLGSDFQPAEFAHEAVFDDVHGRIEMRLRAQKRQWVQWGASGRLFESGEAIVTEHSYKYTPEQFDGMLAAAGFSVRNMWTDPRSWFGVFLAQR